DPGQHLAAVAFLLGDEIAERDNPDRPVTRDNRQAPHRVVTHELHRVGNPSGRLQTNQVRAADLTDRGRRQVAVLGDAADGDVAVDDDAEDAAVLHDDDGADVVVAHPAGRLDDRYGALDRFGIGRHDVTNHSSHFSIPPFCANTKHDYGS